jgi:hypothetical protein
MDRRLQRINHVFDQPRSAVSCVGALVARAGIEPATFRFSGGLGRYTVVFPLVKRALVPLTGPFGRTDPPLWPHIGRMYAVLGLRLWRRLCSRTGG